jgi:predicted trehalose synthase
MVRSFGYAAYVAELAQAPAQPGIGEGPAAWAATWQGWVTAAFLRTYLDAAGGAGFLPSDRPSFDTLLRVFALEKALYELRYEADHRPHWASIPLRGILELLPR